MAYKRELWSERRMGSRGESEAQVLTCLLNAYAPCFSRSRPSQALPTQESAISMVGNSLSGLVQQGRADMVRRFTQGQ